MKRFLKILLVLFPVVGMSQVAETLVCEGDTFPIQEQPLQEMILRDSSFRICFQSAWMETNTCQSTICDRGYQGQWEIRNDSLFLVQLLTCCGVEETPDTIDADLCLRDFSRGDAIFARWVSQDLRVQCFDINCPGYNRFWRVRNGHVRYDNAYPEFEEDVLKRKSDLEIELPIERDYWPFFVGILGFLVMFIAIIVIVVRSKKVEKKRRGPMGS